MIQSVHITNEANETLDLNLWNVDIGDPLGADKLRIFNIEGLGSPKATVTGLSGPFYDGVRGQFVRADSRHLLITLIITKRGNNEELARRYIYKYFPGKSEIKFRVVTDTKDVYTMGVVESVELNHFSKSMHAIISINCSDPYFLGSVEEWGYAVIDDVSHIVTYDGSLPIGALITVIFGHPYTDGIATISNSNRNQSMKINFATLPHGSRYIIDTRSGQRSITYVNGETGLEYDIMDGLSSDSDWIQLYSGENIFTVTLSGNDEGTVEEVPPQSNLQVYLPLNRPYGGDPLELEDNLNFYEVGGSTLHDDGKIYPHIRSFVPEDTTAIHSVLAPQLCPTGDFTLIAWIYPNDTGGNKEILYGMSEDDGFYIKYWYNNFRACINYDGTEQYAERNTAPNVWQCWTTYFDASETTLTVSRDHGAVYSTNPNVIPPNAYTAIWKLGGSGNAYFDGLIGPIIFYNLLLTTAQRTYMYNSGRGRTYAELSETEEIIVEYDEILCQGI